MSTAKQKNIEEIKRDMFAGDDKTVLKALHRCREEGTAALVEPLIHVFATTKSAGIREEASDMLNTLKVSNAEEAFMNALRKPEWKASRKHLLAFMWNSGIQPLEFMAEIATIATEGDFEVALECLTLLESLEDMMPEEQLLESVAVLRTYLADDHNSDKASLLLQYLAILEGTEENFDEPEM
jgi:hypothetical protein